MIHQAAWRGDDHVDAAAQPVRLLLHPGTAIDGSGAQRCLGGQLAGGVEGAGEESAMWLGPVL